ncbi:DUF2510 domain-containing protein [Streptomyces hydrogenans]|uniref:DUF2510 domain-containing protein n=1 Tax=Streptomyces hydrogenans TaxID=1873719 RepID=UPI0035DF1C33
MSGWYKDSRGDERWHDGISWTNHTRFGSSAGNSVPPSGSPTGPSLFGEEPAQPRSVWSTDRKSATGRQESNPSWEDSPSATTSSIRGLLIGCGCLVAPSC